MSTTETEMPRTAAEVRAHLPTPLRLGLARGVVEVKQFTRDRQALVFSAAFPVVLLLFFGEIFKGTLGNGGNVTTAQYFLASMTAFGIMSTSFVSLGVGIAVERDDGTLKRLRCAPMPRSAYFIGKVVLVFVTSIAETALLCVIGVAVLGVHLPHSPARWGTFVWVYLLGVTCFALLGVAVSSLAGSGRNAGAVINLPYILLQFVSGVFIPFGELPRWIQQVGAVFPAKWLAQGLRSVFLPEAAAVVEPSHSWQHGLTALVLAAWCVAGLVLCLTTFRWKGRRDG